MKLSFLIRNGKPWGDYICLANALLVEPGDKHFVDLKGNRHARRDGDTFIPLEDFGIKVVWDVTVPGDPRVRAVRYKGTRFAIGDQSMQYGGTNREFVEGIAVPDKLWQIFKDGSHYVEVDGQVFENHFSGNATTKEQHE